MISVSIINVTSYTGLELLRYLAQHPQFVVTSATARSAAGKRLGEVFPQLWANLSVHGKTATAIDPALVLTEEPEQTDLAFVCLPHAAAAEMVVRLLEKGTKVVDLSADFRLHDVAIYEEWYKHTHLAPALLETSVYGLCERHRERIQHASLVANPGCHSTTAILALMPALAAGIIEPDVIIDSKTGVSGAGRNPSLVSHYAEVSENVNAYSLPGHRHTAEIVQELEEVAAAGGHAIDGQLRVTFLAHMMPMTRGILASCYTRLKSADTSERLPTEAEIRALYKSYYADEPFVHVIDESPHTKWTYGSNHCFIHPFVDKRTQRLIVLSCLDNLGKGASSQAIQNANLLYGLPETTGLATMGVHP